MAKVFIPVSDDDREAADSYHINQMVRQKTSGARKQRAYRELCCYKGSVKYIKDQNLDKNKDTVEKVDALTKITLGFIKGTYVDPWGGVQFIPDSLSYDNCDQPRSHRFIASALEYHAGLVGIDTADEYVAHLRQLGQGYA